MSRRRGPRFPGRRTEGQDPERTGGFVARTGCGDVEVPEPDKTAPSITAGSYISSETADGSPRRRPTGPGRVGQPDESICISVPVYVNYVCSGDIRY